MSRQPGRSQAEPSQSQEAWSLRQWIEDWREEVGFSVFLTVKFLVYVGVVLGALWLSARPAQAQPPETFSDGSDRTANMVLWLDADDTGTIYTDSACTAPAGNGDQVACWADKSSNGHDVTIGDTSGFRPEYVSSDALFGNRAVLDFDGNDRLLNNINDVATRNFTLFMVLASDDPAPSNFESFFSNANAPGNSGSLQITHQNNEFQLNTNGAGHHVFGPFEHNVIKLYGVRARQNPSNLLQLFSEGKQVAAAAVNTVFRFRLLKINTNRNSAHFHDSRIAEVILYDAALSDCQLSEVNAYLGTKYGADFTGAFENLYTTGHPENLNRDAIGRNDSSNCLGPQSDRRDSATSAEMTFDVGAGAGVNDTSADYVITAHQGGDVTQFTTTTVASVGADYRVRDRHWRREEQGSGDLGNDPLSFSFDYAAMGLTGGEGFALLVSPDSDFANAEVVSTSFAVDTGTGTVTFDPVVLNTSGDTAALDLEPYNESTGAGDLFVTLATAPVDRSDAPVTGTSYGEATHTVTAGLQLGVAIDADANPLASPDADGDDTNGTDDEDGVTLPALYQGIPARISVAVSESALNDGYLQAWIDWNGDGTFDPGEQVATDLQDNQTGDENAATGTIDFIVTPPVTATTSQTFARFRWSTAAGLDATAAAPDGEVEDHAVTVTAMSQMVCDGTFYQVRGALLTEVTLSYNSGTGQYDANFNNSPNSGSNKNGAWGVWENGDSVLGYGVLNNSRRLYAVDAAGSFVDLGLIDISAFPGASSFSRSAGDIDDDGNLYVFNVSNNRIYVVDLKQTPAVLTHNIAAGFGINAADFIYNGADQVFYGIDSNARRVAAIKVDLTGAGSASLVRFGPTGPPYNDTFGAGWFDATGATLFAFRNGNGNVYQVDTGLNTGPGLNPGGTGSAFLLGSGPGAGGNDGLGCRGARPFPYGTLEGTVYVDADGDRVVDSGEGAAAGAGLTVELYSSGNLIRTVTTDANGEYRFPAVISDFVYRVRVPAFTVGPPGNAATRTVEFLDNVTVADGGVVSGLDFAYGPADYSDAPTGYGDTYHVTRTGYTLGAAVTTETAPAGNDGVSDADDGVTLPALTVGQGATIRVDVVGAGGYLQGWIDWNGDGAFDAGEQIASDVQDGGTGDTDAAPGTIGIAVSVPPGATPSQTFARFRWSTTQGLDAVTAAGDGEVEDYALTVIADSIITGSVFNDSGLGGGTAHNGLLEGAEEGIGAATIEAFDGTTLLASTTSAGDGSYSLALPASAAGTAVTLRATLPGVGLRHISAAPGTGVSDADAFDGEMALTPVLGTNYTADFGAAGEPGLAADRIQSVMPGGTGLFAHVFSSDTQMSVEMSVVDIVESTPGGFAITLFADADCDGDVDAGETVLSNPASVSANTQLCVIARIATTPGLADGSSVTFDLEAVATYVGTGQTITLRNSDRLDVGASGAMTLTKQVCNQSQTVCDVATGAGFGLSNNGAPGDVLIYRLVSAPNGSAAVDNVSVHDTTPAYSALTASAPAVVAGPGGLSCALAVPAVPTAGYQGPLNWTCTGSMPPGEQLVVSFEVAIAD